MKVDLGAYSGDDFETTFRARLGAGLVVGLGASSEASFCPIWGVVLGYDLLFKMIKITIIWVKMA